MLIAFFSCTHTKNVNVGLYYKDHFTSFSLLHFTPSGCWEGEEPLAPGDFGAYWWVCMPQDFMMCWYVCNLSLWFWLQSPASSWLHLLSCCSCVMCSGWAAVWIVHLGGMKTFPPTFSTHLGTFYWEDSFPLMTSPATSARGYSQTTSAVKGNVLWIMSSLSEVLHQCLQLYL